VEYQPQIRLRGLNEDGDGLDSEKEAHVMQTLTSTLNAGRSDPGSVIHVAIHALA
jgi:hypothetical protein